MSLFACSPGSEVDGVTLDVEDNLPGGGNGGGASMPPTVPTSPDDANDLYDDPPAPGCGDAEKADDEACDDGNRDNLDGCSGNCLVVETGYTCDVPGSACALVALCGDARRVLDEGCDDGNANGGDGCASNCQIEAGYACPMPGQPCLSTAVCGDGFVALGEACDDGNADAADGCTECALAPGFACPLPGAKCQPVCGDGILAGNERCDDGNAEGADGCAANCRLEPGFACDVPGTACDETACQDGLREGSEQCDDGNDVPFDGCTAACVNEPNCVFVAGTYTCVAVCGDGMKFPEEACDDGNTQPDDGCSPECALEAGYACADSAPDQGDVLALPIIYRDFSNTHPHFEIDPQNSPRLPGIVLDRLSDDGNPIYNPDFTFNARAWTMDGPDDGNAATPKIANQTATLDAGEISERFIEWYTDVGGVNQTFVSTLDLGLQPDGSFQFAASGLGNQFFPIDGLGFGNQGNPNNFHFTSETRQWFEFQGGEQLTFSGDDDVWVFINGQLTVDLGGIHEELIGSIELSDDGLGSELCVQDAAGQLPVPCALIDVRVNPEGVNEIVVFQAERHVTQSNYTLTLRGFNAPVTTCGSVCGDGVLTPDETCDDGPRNGTGYGQCITTECVPGPRCGDGILEPTEEQCDNGANRDGYQVSSEACAPGCVIPSRCGDGTIDGAFGEQCDDGTNDGSYRGCNPDCLLGPRCGDGTVNGDEACDDGNRRNGDGCDVSCRLDRVPA